MADRVHPSSKPAVNGVSTAAAATAIPVANGNGTAAPAPIKPNPRPQYRPQQPQYHHRRRRQSGRRICCCCCFWSILLLLALALLAAIAGAAVYVLYRPHTPQFTLASLRVARLNLTTASDSSTSHISSLLNLTIAIKNPNNHVVFFYDSFSVAFLTDDDGRVQIANGTIPSFVGGKGNETTFRAIATASRDLDTEATAALRSDLRRKTGVPMRIEMDTKVKVQMESVKSKKVGIRVTCVGLKAVPPKGKTPMAVSVAGAKCKVDLRIKIWKWTF